MRVEKLILKCKRIPSSIFVNYFTDSVKLREHPIFKWSYNETQTDEMFMPKFCIFWKKIKNYKIENKPNTPFTKNSFSHYYFSSREIDAKITDKSVHDF